MIENETSPPAPEQQEQKEKEKGKEIEEKEHNQFKILQTGILNQALQN
jgi:hypothetical protein